MASASDVKSQLNPEAAAVYGNVTDIMRLLDPEMYNNAVSANGEMGADMAAYNFSVRANDKIFQLEEEAGITSAHIEHVTEQQALAKAGHHKDGWFDFQEEQDGLDDYKKRMEDLEARYANNIESAPGYAELKGQIEAKQAAYDGYTDEINNLNKINIKQQAELAKQQCYSDYFKAYESGDVEKLNELTPQFSSYMSKDLAARYPQSSPEYGEAMTMSNRLNDFSNGVGQPEASSVEKPVDVELNNAENLDGVSTVSETKTEEVKIETPESKIEIPEVKTEETKVETKDVAAPAPMEEVNTLESSEAKTGDGKPNPYAFEKPPCPSGMPASAYETMCAAQEAEHIKAVNAKVADEIWNEGKWGNGQERIDNLTAAGYDVAGVQAAVNEKIAGLEKSGALKQEPIQSAVNEADGYTSNEPGFQNGKNMAAAVEEEKSEPLEDSFEGKEIGDAQPPVYQEPKSVSRRAVVPPLAVSEQQIVSRKEHPVPAATAEGLADISNSMQEGGAFLPDMPSRGQASLDLDGKPQGQGGVYTDGNEQGKGGVETDGKEQGKGSVDDNTGLYIDESELGKNGKNMYIDENELGKNGKTKVSSSRFDSAANLYNGDKHEASNDNDYDPMDNN